MSFLLDIYLQPGAKSTEFAGMHDQRLKIRVKASPIEGKANKELITFLAKFFNVRKQDISIAQGEKSRFKTLSIDSDSEAIKECLSKIHKS